MSRELRILILEDVSTDAELMADELRESGLAFTPLHVADRPGYVRALAEFSPDLILSDYAMPSFDGLSALRIARETAGDIPFLFVSGAVGEERAIELLREGATDYVLKDRLSRLGPAVSRALKEVAERRERQRCEIALQESESSYRTIFENTGTATLLIEDYETILLANRQFELLSGFSRAEVEGRKLWKEFVHRDDLPRARDRRRAPRPEPGAPAASWELRVIDRRGRVLDVLARIAAIPRTRRVVVSLLDITHLKEAEQEIRATNERLRSLTSELVMMEDRERRRIAVELHDQIAQTLALAKLETDALSSRAAGSALEPSCGRIGDLLHESIRQTRSLMREISPSVLYELGLAEAILWLADQFQAKHGLEVAVTNGLGDGKIDQDLQVLLFRAVRELLMNVVKHAGTGRAEVSLQRSGESLSLTVRDEGAGIGAAGAESEAGGGFGLLSIRERVLHLGGRFEIESEEDRGTVVRLSVAGTRGKKRPRRRGER